MGFAMRNGILNIIRRITLLTVLIILSGCGEKEIAGQIFVVTQAKDNIKLALVTVGAIPQEEFDQYLKAKQSEKLKQQEPLQMKYKEAKNKKIDSLSDIPGAVTGTERNN
jgi:rRNA pseudouridine-1189 N-methylase Emg1 (Nep1/Mra1 family)